jgi:Protein of unknown function (DUF998)
LPLRQQGNGFRRFGSKTRKDSRFSKPWRILPLFEEVGQKPVYMVNPWYNLYKKRKMHGDKSVANVHGGLSRANHPDPAAFVDAPPSLVQRLLLLCGVVGPVLFIVSYLIEGAIHPGYDLLRQTISELEILTNRWMQVANFIVFGLLIACFAIGLRNALGRGRAVIP